MNISHELIVVGSAALPIIELRGAIPLAIAVYDFSWLSALLWSLLGNGVAAVGLVLLLGRIFEWSEHRWYRLNRLLAWAYDRAHRNHSAKIERLEWLALFLLVAIPLPFTGAWTGALVATVMGIDPRRSLPPILAGIIVAGVIVIILTTGVITIV